MTKNDHRLVALLLALMLTMTCFLTGCGGKKDGDEGEEAKNPNMGQKQEIPWINLEGWEFLTSDKVEWTFEPVGSDGGQSYGIAEEVITERNAPIENWYYGQDVYQNVYKGVTMAKYEELIKKLKDTGYQVYSSGDINGDTYYTLLTYETFVYNVSFFVNKGLAYVTASPERPLSPYLLEDNVSTQSEAIPGKDATLNMLRWQEGGGDNYIIQLKNGHFILFDGGSYHMMAKALEFMEANVPKGEIPVVDAWFVSHGHYDHVGWTVAFYGGYSDMGGLLTMGEAARRIRVNGVYFNQTNDEVIEHTTYGWRSDGYRNKGKNQWPYCIDQAVVGMVTESGDQTPLYRPQAGQTYYFKDLTVEIPYTQEQIPFADYQMDINAASLWCVVKADGKVFLDGGDAENVNMEFVKSAYTKDYAAFAGNVDIMNAFHHGHNIYSDYIDTFHAPIVFYTSKTMFQWASQYTQANRDMIANYDVDYYCYGEGAYQYNFTTGKVTKIG